MTRPYDDEIRKQTIKLAYRIGPRRAAEQTGIPLATVKSWRYPKAPRKKLARPVPDTLCQCGEIATEAVRMDSGHDQWTEWLCDGCAELEREQADLAAGRGEARKGLWQCAT